MVELEMINAVDEVLDGAEKFNIIKADNTTLAINCSITLATPLINEGTKLNKELFDKIDRNFQRLVRLLNSKKVGDDYFKFLTTGEYDGQFTPDLADPPLPE